MAQHLTKIDAHIAVWGLVATALTALVGGAELFPSALVGAALASINWIVFRTLALRMTESSKKLGLGLFLALKSFAMLGGIFLLLKLLPLHPAAFLAGMSGLFLGIVTSTIGHALKPSESPVERKS